MLNKHTIAKRVKQILYGKAESYQFNNKKLRFITGTRPIRKKYINAESDVVRNDVLQIEFFEKNFKAGDTLWDIGSHHGHYSIFAASIVNSDKQVFSFEPDPDARVMQLKNIALNHFEKKITVFDFAISGKNEVLQFMAEGGNSNSHLVKGLPEGNTANILSVQGRTIDSMLEELPAPDFIKIDVEGAEIDVLRAASKLLENKKVQFICELHPFAWEAFGVAFEEFQDILKRYDRTIRLLDTSKKQTDLPYYGTLLF
jgi:FkbM family methyltransferase